MIEDPEHNFFPAILAANILILWNILKPKKKAGLEFNPAFVFL